MKYLAAAALLAFTPAMLPPLTSAANAVEPAGDDPTGVRSISGLMDSLNKIKSGEWPPRRPTTATINAPTRYQALWCTFPGTRAQYYRCQEAESEGYFEIRGSRIHLYEEDGDVCRIHGVAPITKGHRLYVRCTGPQGNGEIRVDLWLDARGHLHWPQSQPAE